MTTTAKPHRRFLDRLLNGLSHSQPTKGDCRVLSGHRAQSGLANPDKIALSYWRDFLGASAAPHQMKANGLTGFWCHLP